MTNSHQHYPLTDGTEALIHRASDAYAAELRTSGGVNIPAQNGQPVAAAAEGRGKEWLLSAAVMYQVRGLVERAEIIGDETDLEKADFLLNNLPHLAAITNGSYAAPRDTAQVLTWLQSNNPTGNPAESIYLTFTEHLQSVAATFAEISKVVRSALSADEKEISPDTVSAKAMQAIRAVRAAFVREVEGEDLGLA